MEDSTTQNVLSTFVGSFLFSLVGIIVLSTGAYGAQGRVVLFGATIVVIVLIVVTLLRWIDHLSRLGRVTETTALVEQATRDAMRERHTTPYLGGSPLTAGTESRALAVPVHAREIGYVQHVDVGALSDLIGDRPGAIYLAAIPGDFVDPSQPIAWVHGLGADDTETSIRSHFTIGETRSYDQDPRFGASVMAEIASRALSPGINDPGTAIDVLGRTVRVLAIWAEPVPEEAPKYPKVYVPALSIDDLFDDLFTPIARDGAGTVEVGMRLQKAFATLVRFNPERFGRPARRHSGEALQRSALQLVPFEQERLVELASKI